MNLFNQMAFIYSKCMGRLNGTHKDLEALLSPLQAREFVKQYYVHCGNGMLITPFIKGEGGLQDTYTVSAFLFGLLIKKKICPELEVVINKNEIINFEDLWFLVCLYHDIGYIQENDWTYKYIYELKTQEYLKTYKATKCDKEIRYVYEDLGLLYVAPSLFQYKQLANDTKDVQDNLGIRFNNGSEVVRARYARDTIMKYLECSKMDENVHRYDHGIIGGLWLYDSLMKDYNLQYRNVRLHKNAVFDDFKTGQGVHFTKELTKVFAYLADCIISHNMLPADGLTNTKYEKCGLKELTLEKFTKIRFEDNPLLFLLILVDIIEPIQIYGEYLSVEEIWRGIDVEFEKEYLIIKMLDDRMPYEYMAKRALRLDKQLEVRVMIDTRCKEIEIQY